MWATEEGQNELWLRAMALGRPNVNVKAKIQLFSTEPCQLMQVLHVCPRSVVRVDDAAVELAVVSPSVVPLHGEERWTMKAEPHQTASAIDREVS